MTYLSQSLLAVAMAFFVLGLSSAEASQSSEISLVSLMFPRGKRVRSSVDEEGQGRSASGTFIT